MTVVATPETFKAELRREGSNWVLEYQETFHTAAPGFLQASRAQCVASVDFLLQLNPANGSWAAPNADGSPGATVFVRVVSDERKDVAAGLLGELMAQYVHEFDAEDARKALMDHVGIVLGGVEAPGVERITFKDVDAAIDRMKHTRGFAFAAMVLPQKKRIAAMLAGLPLAYFILKRAGVVEHDTYGEFLVHVLGIG